VSCIGPLLEYRAPITMVNGEGLQPIQCALLIEGADVGCVDELLEYDMGQAMVKDSKGNGLLHLAKTSQMVQCLIHHKVDTNLLNCDGQTALHKAVMEPSKPLTQTLALVFNGFDIDMVDASGNTALHVLVQKPAPKGSDKESLIKALVVLGADLSLRNREGKTVFQLATEEGGRAVAKLVMGVGADDMAYLQPKAYSHLDKEVHTASGTAPRPRDAWNKNSAAVLCLDGGGIKGLVLIQMLLDIERRTGLEVRDLFDWVGGTSTGGMLALALIYARKSTRDCQKLYFGLKDQVFVGSRPYDTDTLENFLKQYYTGDAKMTSQQFPRVLIPTTIADCRPCKLHVFKNYGFRVENDVQLPECQPVWEVARATGAAPTYFTPYKRFLDGGLMANNPTITMLTELHECNQDPGRLGYEARNHLSFAEGLMRVAVDAAFTTGANPDDYRVSGVIESRPTTEGPLVKDVEQEPTHPYVVVSLGTGLAPEVQVGHYNVSQIDNPMSAGRFLWGAKELVETLVEQCAGTDGTVVHGAKAWCESIGANYFRLQPQLSYNMKLDEIDNKNLIECLWDVQCFIYSERDKFSKVSELLASAF